MASRRWALPASLALLACSQAAPDRGAAPGSAVSSTGSPPAAQSASNGAATSAAAAVVVPPTAKRSEAKLPLLVALHGYGGSGASFARFLRLRQQSIKRGFVFIAPDGHSGADGKRFWNASPACCDFDGSGVDHVAELGKLITEAQRSEHVDPTRVLVLGYSNGGFMAHRLACDLPGISAIASIAGAGVTHADACAHAPARILEVHGDVDQVVPFAGGRVLGKTGIPAFPGALETMTAWAKKRGCDAAPSAPTKLDLDPALPGSETAQIGWSCAPGLALWRVEGGTHSLATGSSELDVILDELLKN